MGGSIDAGNCYLLKKPYRNGWRWCGQIRYKDESGRWRTTQKALVDEDGAPIPTDADTIDAEGNKVQTTRNIRRARRALEAWRAEVEGTPTGGRQAVADYIRADLDGREGSVHASTMRKYREYARIIGRYLDGVPMRELDVRRVRAMVRAMKSDGLAPATIKTAFALLHKTCERAAQDGDMAANPCVRGIVREDAPREHAGRRGPNALDAGCIRRANALLDATKNDRLRVGARLALSCGLRAGECCGLRWGDVDLDAPALTVAAAIGRGIGGTYPKEPKTGDGTRVVPLPPYVAAELAAWREVQAAARDRAAEGQGSKVPPLASCYVIGYADGSFLTPHALGNAWSRLARAGDADGPLIGTTGDVVTLHALRHTFATHAVASGIDPKTAAALMGHADATTTLNMYADALPDAKVRAMAEVAGTLGAGTAWAARGSCFTP